MVLYSEDGIIAYFLKKTKLKNRTYLAIYESNFFFEIDREDGFRMKGPSKENRKDPIVGLGLLLDSNLFPVGIKCTPKMNQKS